MKGDMANSWLLYSNLASGGTEEVNCPFTALTDTGNGEKDTGAQAIAKGIITSSEATKILCLSLMSIISRSPILCSCAIILYKCYLHNIELTTKIIISSNGTEMMRL
jgi:hypothetical protein